MEAQKLYQNIKNRWKNAEPTVAGVLGGHGFFHEYDIKSSKWFLDNLKRNGYVKGGYAIDCCAGIGRVTQNVLCHYFDKIDLFDQEPKFINQANLSFVGNEKIGKIEVSSMQDYQFDKKYDTIWLQWTMDCFADDEDMLRFLTKCKDALKDDGIIVAKENICSEDDDFFQGNEQRIRSQYFLKNVFDKSGFDIIFEHVPTEDEWEIDFFRVASFALKKKS